MKLPEHYEKWLDEEYPSIDEEYPSKHSIYHPYRDGAHRMYAKLMEDFAPAIAALKFCDKTYGSINKFCCSNVAIEHLKEKGLVE